MDGRLRTRVTGPRTPRLSGWCLALACALGAPAVHAQDRPVVEVQGDGEVATVRGDPPRPELGGNGTRGKGFTLGANSALHLGIDAGVGFDTNPYSVPLAAATFSGDMIARVRPNLQLQTQGSLLTFTGAGYVDYGFMPGLIDPATQQFLLYQSGLDADLEINRGAMFTFALGDGVTWNSDPGAVTLGALYNRLNNQLRSGIGMTPGGGALQWRLSYAFDFTKYFDVQERGGIISEGALDMMRHTMKLRTDYKFLPKTGGFIVATAGWASYPFSPINPPAFPVSAVVGVQGVLLTKLAGLLSLGYANPLVVDNDGSGNISVVTGSLIGVVGQAELRWQPSETTQLGGGFQRSFDPAPLYQYVGSNRFYGQYSQMLAGRFNLLLKSSYTIFEFGAEQEFAPNQFFTNATGDRLDGHLDVGLQLRYFLMDWFSIGVSNRVNWRLTNADAITTTTPTNLSFLRNETLFLASMSY